MKIPRDLKYTETHEWIRFDGDLAIVGITDFAQHQLSDVTFVELPTADDEVSTQDEVAVVESVKAASDIYAPLSGRIVAVNEDLTAKPELINSDPYGAGWIFKLRPANREELQDLLDSEQYETITADEAG